MNNYLTTTAIKHLNLDICVARHWHFFDTRRKNCIYMLVTKLGLASLNLYRNCLSR